MLDPRALAHEFFSTYGNSATIVPPSARDPQFDLSTAYAVETEFKQLRIDSGRTTTGRKVGYASKAMWRLLKLETLVSAHMYDDTVHYGTPELSIAHLRSPKIEPEIVLKLTRDAVEWVAIGFEIIDCPFPDWQFKPVDFVAAYGLHIGLIVGQPHPMELISAEQLASFTLKLIKNGRMIEQGAGKNSLGSPLKCLAELQRHETLAVGELVSTGTLTTAQPIAPGEVWSIEIEGLPISNLTLGLT